MTANCLHPATFMPTKMVTEAGGTPMSSLEEGVEATLRLVTTGAGGSDRTLLRRHGRGARASAGIPMEARRRLRELSEQLVWT